MTKLRLITCAAMLAWMSGSAYAGLSYRPIFGLTTGLTELTALQSRTVNFKVDEFGSIENNFYTPSPKNVQAIATNIHAGALFDVPKYNFKFTSELAGFHQSTSTIKGDLWGQSVPLFNNFDYSYDVESLGLMLESRVMMQRRWLVGYVLGGMGAAWNRASNFKETPNNETAVSFRGNFPSDTHVSFACEAGLGLGVQGKHLLVALEYKQVRLGKAQFDRYSFQTINDPFAIQLHSQQILLNISYII